MTKQNNASPTTFRTILKWVGAIATIIAAGGSSGVLASSAQSDNSSERIAILETKQQANENTNELILDRIKDVLEEVRYVRDRVDRCQER
ncbi:MAG: hypothetical protein WCR96_03280 [Candidatus Methanomethylophilaceae archaeon]|jgi:hypothetical protein